LRIAETPVNHRARTLGVSKYTNWNRALRGIYDLFGVRWLLNRKVVYPKVEHHNEQ
jgi:dolichol-phosphate mannosyltransferase